MNITYEMKYVYSPYMYLKEMSQLVMKIMNILFGNNTQNRICSNIFRYIARIIEQIKTLFISLLIQTLII